MKLKFEGSLMFLKKKPLSHQLFSTQYTHIKKKEEKNVVVIMTSFYHISGCLISAKTMPRTYRFLINLFFPKIHTANLSYAFKTQLSLESKTFSAG